ncbi:MAG: hypothetical protein Q9195_005998 [Heterodermia aff. obscurata]
MSLPPKLTVYRGFHAPSAHVWSPFVIKLEARLRFSNFAYTTAVGSLWKAPTGKVPYVELTDSEHEGATITLGDSGLIIKRLVESGALGELSTTGEKEGEERERGMDLALRALVEEKLYFYHAHERWMDNYYPMRNHILQSLPYPLRVLVGWWIYRRIVQTLYGQGTGRYTPAEIAGLRREIWVRLRFSGFLFSLSPLIPSPSFLCVTFSFSSAATKTSELSKKLKQESIAALLTASKHASTADSSSSDEKPPFWILGGSSPSEADASIFGFIVTVLLCTAYVAPLSLSLPIHNSNSR